MFCSYNITAINRLLDKIHRQGAFIVSRKKLTPSEIDGVQYRRVPTWQVAVGMLLNGSAMAFYILMGMMSYLGGAGYGIATAVIGIILSASRIFDGLIDPFLAVWIDKFNTRFGKMRILLLLGFVIRAAAVLMLFVWFSNGSQGIVLFVALYLINIIGNSIFDIVGNMTGPIMTNDPKQRPTIQVWATIYNYLFPMAFTLLSTMVLLPRFGNEYTVPFLSLFCIIQVVVAGVLTLISFIGLTPVDKPENFIGIAATTDEYKVSMGDMFRFLRSNKPFRLYIYAAVSDKLAQNVLSQSIVSTMLFGILIGDMQFGTLISMISMLPSIIFAIIGAKFAGARGNKEATVVWTWICTIIAVVSVIFCGVIDMTLIKSNIIFTAIFFVLLLGGNGAKMCVTMANGAMRADIIDYELDRSGKYLPAVVTATYNFVDQIVTSLGATIATTSVALIGYVNTLPQPTDAPTPAIKWVTMGLYFGLPILGWICTFIAMKFYRLTKEEMVNVQKRIADKKAELLSHAEV